MVVPNSGLFISQEILSINGMIQGYPHFRKPSYLHHTTEPMCLKKHATLQNRSNTTRQNTLPSFTSIFPYCCVLQTGYGSKLSFCLIDSTYAKNIPLPDCIPIGSWLLLVLLRMLLFALTTVAINHNYKSMYTTGKIVVFYTQLLTITNSDNPDESSPSIIPFLFLMNVLQ